MTVKNHVLIRIKHMKLRPGERQNLPANLRRIFAARIVVGHNNKIGSLGGGLAFTGSGIVIAVLGSLIPNKNRITY